MESNTFSHINFIVRAEEARSFVPGKDVFCSFLFDIESQLEIESVFSLIFSENNEGPLFSVTISMGHDPAVKEDWFNKLCLILSHHKYKKSANRLLIGLLFNQDSVDQQKAFSQQLALELTGQNFDFLIAELNQGPVESDDLPFAYFDEPGLTGDDFYRWYKNRLTNNGSLLNLFYKVDKGTVEKILSRKAKAEERLRKEDPILFKLIEQETLFAAKEEQLTMTIENLKADLSSKTAYLDFLLQKNSDTLSNSGIDLIPSMRIKKFYHDEYEILPLWYKRVGHIIKVIMGKRSFKSLFNDNVKKYKD